MARALPHAIGFLLPPVIVAGATLGGMWTFLPLAERSRLERRAARSA